MTEIEITRLVASRHWRYNILFLIIFSMCLALCPPTDAASRTRKQDSTTIRVLPLDAKNPVRSKTGVLEWRGGIEILHDDPRFGGISALNVTNDGRRMLAITDRATWITGELIYNDGKLVGAGRIRIGYLKGLRSNRLPSRWSDAESLSPDGAGGFYVSFELRHRIWRYPPPDRNGGLSGRPLPVPVPKEFEDQPLEGGVEALTRTCDGQLLAISEAMRAGPGTNRGWLRTANGWKDLAYTTKDRYKPTGAATMPDCDVLIVERQFSVLSGFRARIVRVAANTIKPGATLVGQELAVLAPPLNVDNMEGIATRRGENGEILIYVVSDDNFSGLQRTLLLLFALPSGKLPVGD